ncbi:MAG: hypothetical protein ABI574_20145 [Burkholderiales bacterium]
MAQQAAPRPGVPADNDPLLDPTHYALLGVPEDALADAIDRAWRSLCAERPALPTAEAGQPSLVLPGVPDSPALQAAARRLAYAVLSDPARRAVYDDWLAARRAALNATQQRARWWRQPLARAALAVLVLALAGVAVFWWLSR